MKKQFTWHTFILAIFISCSEPVGPERTASTGELYTDASGLVRDGGSGPSPGGDNDGNDQPGVVTAGEWNDNLHWNFWKDLMAEEEFSGYRTAWGFSPLTRISILLKDILQKPLVDATVEVRNAEGELLWQAKSDDYGMAVAWPNLFNSSASAWILTVRHEGNSFSFSNQTLSIHDLNEFIVPVNPGPNLNADIMFVVDATGSMGDELEYLKVELNDVLERASEDNCVAWRTGSVFYRDDGDEYVTRISGFTSNPSATINFVKGQEANGGGDWPEAVHTALHDAIHSVSWSEKARARLLFLVLDAPPHDIDQIKAQIRDETVEAAKKGIKIIPVTASGIDKSTEFLMRSISLATNGTYVFITDHSGIGGDHLEPTVGDYKVEKLNDLLVRVIRKYTSCTYQ